MYLIFLFIRTNNLHIVYVLIYSKLIFVFIIELNTLKRGGKKS